MIPVHVAIIDDTKTINEGNLAILAGALNAQIQNDVAPYWHVAATCSAYPTGLIHTWSIHIQQQLDQPGALGYHTDDNNQPIAYVELTSDYTVTVSHELLEMLVDPYGCRMTTAGLIDGLDYANFGLGIPSERVAYLLEVCDPCESSSYQTGGVAVSDFLLPSWYRTFPGPGAYTHMQSCTKPCQVNDGGYVSFCNKEREWYQVFNENGQLSSQDLGKFDKASYGSPRGGVDKKARA